MQVHARLECATGGEMAISGIMLPFLVSARSYLLIAQPQSSSTSAMTQVGHMAGLGAKQELCACLHDARTAPTTNQIQSRFARRSPCYAQACHDDGCYQRSDTFFPMLDHSDICELHVAAL